MISRRQLSLALSDEQLIDDARGGSSEAYAELWNRHASAAHFTARQVTSSSDPDDLVVEAFARILEKIRAGGGPNGAFRPYLYATIRNLARTWGTKQTEVDVEDFDQIEDPKSLGDDAVDAFENAVTIKAFRSLPERWRQVLWYTVVEEMEPREVAPLLGVTANSAAALSYRAREGLRAAWLQAHVSDSQNATTDAECVWSIEHLGEHARHSLSTRNRHRIDAHLATCRDCSHIAGELEDVGSRLAMALLPLVLGGVGAAAWVAAGRAPAAVAAATVTGAAGTSIAAGAGSSGSAASAGGSLLGAGSVVSGAAGLGVAGGAGIVGTASGVTAILAVAGIGLAIAGTVGAAADPTPVPSVSAVSTAASSASVGARNSAAVAGAASSGASSPQTGPGAPAIAAAPPASTGSPLATAVPGAPVLPQASANVGVQVGSQVNAGVGVSVGGNGVAASVQATAPAGIGLATSVVLSGTATPGATVDVRAAGVTLGSVVVAEDGTWSLTLAKPTSPTSTLQVVQSLPLVGGLLGGVLNILPVNVDTVLPGVTITSSTAPR